MKVLFDTNVVLDLLLDRKPYVVAATHLFSKVETGTLQGYLCATTMTTIYYLAAKVVGESQACKEINSLLSLFEVAAVTRPVLEAALDDKFSDFEDAVVYEAARQVKAQAVVTRNATDFKKAKLSIYSPEELIKILRLN